jgi:hypothetical protein
MTNWKGHVNVGVEINQIKSQIKKIKSLLVNWGLKCINSEPMQIAINFEADY